MATQTKKISTTARIREQQKNTKKLEGEFRTSLLDLIAKGELEEYSPETREKEISIPSELAKREKIKNDALQQDITLKKITLVILFIFLACETIVIFFFTYLQATNTFNFRLEEWSFKLLITATILQITYMLQVAVKHLFPNK